MNYVHKRRLLKMADFLGKVPSKHFDLNWYTHNFGNIRVQNQLEKIRKDMKQHTCGATACAIGWMPAIFPLTFQWNRYGEIVYKNENFLHYNINFTVAKQHLNLNTDEINYLFLNRYYPVGRRGPKSVATKIRKFVETGRISHKTYS